MHKAEDVIAADRSWQGRKFSAAEIHFVCPWHGDEYDLQTGECAADRKLRLKSFDVVRRGEDVYVIAG
jgi:nitrite reductase/ring-hydroxylating ferredoxin subunit